MTEQEWLASEDPQEMLRDVFSYHFAYGAREPIIQSRKLRLYGAGICRLLWDQLTDPRARKAILVAEKWADGQATEAKLDDAARLAARTCPTERSPYDVTIWVCDDSGSWLSQVMGEAEGNGITDAQMAHLLRDLFPSPKGPPTSLDYSPGGNDSFMSLAVTTAWQAYDEHDFGLLPIIADMVEDSAWKIGTEGLLAHFRGPGPHCRGCWALDLLLGKE